MLGKLFKYLSLCALFLLQPAYADDDDRQGLRVNVALGTSPCLQIVGDLGEAVHSSSPRTRLRSLIDFFISKPDARTSAASLSASQPYDPRPSDGTRVHYVQSLPGKAKALRARLTAEEVNILLNQMRTLFMAMDIVADDREIQYDFKSTRYNIEPQLEDAASIAASVDRAEDIFRGLQSPFLNSDILGTSGAQLLESRLIAVGSGATEMQAVLAPRFAEANYVRFEDVREKIQSALFQIKVISHQITERFKQHSGWSLFLDEAGGLSLEFFKLGRRYESAEGFAKFLREREPGLADNEIESTAEQMFRLWHLVDKFIPGTQYERAQLEVIDESGAPKDWTYPDGTQSILVADIRSAGARILQEVWQSISREIANHEDHSNLPVEAVIENISIRNSLNYLATSLSSVIQEVSQLEANNVISYWVTGDEVIFYLREPSQIHRAEVPAERNWRIVEGRLTGFEELNRLEQSLLREVLEQAQKFMEEQYFMYEPRSTRLTMTNEGPLLEVFIDESALPVETIFVSDRLKAYLLRSFPEFRHLDNLKLKLVSTP